QMFAHGLPRDRQTARQIGAARLAERRKIREHLPASRIAERVEDWTETHLAPAIALNPISGNGETAAVSSVSVTRMRVPSASGDISISTRDGSISRIVPSG